MRSILNHARVVTPTADFTGALVIESGIITEILPQRSLPEGEDWSGRWLIPGCIDIHSDYWEKEIHPRPGANFPLDMAFHFMDQRAAAAGLTTVYSAISFSDDALKGRSLEAALAQAEALAELRPQGLVRHLVHARLSPNSDGVALALPRIAELAALGMVVINEDIPGQRQFTLDFVIQRHAKNHGVSVEAAQAVVEERIQTLRQINHRAAIQAAFTPRYPLGSHDDTTPEHVEEALRSGCTFSEMPTTLAAAQRAKDLGLLVCMGAPNLVRGGSHCGNLAAAAAWDAGLVDVFCSDYHFPTLLAAVQKLLAAGVSPSAAINTVSLNPARLAGLEDRLGSIAVGKQADLVALQFRQNFAAVEAVWVAGKRRLLTEK